MKLTTDTKKIGNYDIYADKGNPIFLSELDAIDIGGKITAEYRESKLILLSHYFGNNDTEISKNIIYGRGLLYGFSACLDIELQDPFLCKAGSHLGVEPMDVKVELERNRTKIENLRPIMEELSKVEISD